MPDITSSAIIGNPFLKHIGSSLSEWCFSLSITLTPNGYRVA
jgi:hypothetical protein